MAKILPQQDIALTEEEEQQKKRNDDSIQIHFPGKKAENFMHIVFICGHFISHIIYEFGVCGFSLPLPTIGTSIFIFAFDWT